MNFFKTQQQIITEIHNEFDTAQDRLLEQANKILSTPNSEAVQSISDRLIKIGFVNTPTAKKGKEVKKELVETREQAELISYYKNTYLFLKFLTEDELNRICDKYNLIHAPVANFIGEVPEKNIKDIEQAQTLRASDVVTNKIIQKVKFHNKKSIYETAWSNQDIIKKLNIPSEFEGEKFRHTFLFDEWVVTNYKTPEGMRWFADEIITTKIDRSGLFIAAPALDFNLEGLSKNTKNGFFSVFETKVKDPIVFRYVRGGVQIITKWGLEANDPALVLPINN